MNKILNWWNSLPYCQKKKKEWIQKRMTEAKNNSTSNELKWPENVVHKNKEDFKESDWVYDEGNRCERYVMWLFFVDITRRCTILERTPKWHPNDTPGFEGGEAVWVTAYEVLEDFGKNVVRDVEQTDLSF